MSELVKTECTVEAESSIEVAVGSDELAPNKPLTRLPPGSYTVTLISLDKAIAKYRVNETGEEISFPFFRDKL